MKASVELNKSRFVDPKKAAALAGRPEDMEFAQHVADDAVTLVRLNRQILPLQRTWVSPKRGVGPDGDSQARLGVVAIILGEALDGSIGHIFEKALKTRCPDAQVFYFDGDSFQSPLAELLNAASKAQKVVVAAYVTHRGARQVTVNGKFETSFGLLGPSGRLLQQILATSGDKTAVIAFGSPYLIESFPNIQTYICTYAMASTSEISAVKALFGEIQNRAKLPVSLPDIAARGFSLPWPTKPGEKP